MIVRARSIFWGAVAGLGMFIAYAAVIVFASGWAHLTDQLQTDWYFVALIVAGFGVQVALMVELRHRHRLHGTEASATGVGAGASAMGMLACCAHHLTEVAALAGATGALAFLANYRVAFMVGGIVLNGVGIAVASRRLRQLDRHHLGSASCVAA